MAKVNTILEESSADCPGLYVTLAGTADDDVAALASEIQSWSDGAFAKVEIEYSATYYAAAATGTGLTLAIGRGEMTATAAPNGAVIFGYNLNDAADPVVVD